ncbi:MAG: 50S ribosomal protein L30 [Bacteroidetes bacterium]|jgi:large subunit ribosomal protein L30|nr:50S ribosomal protein L30 [Bacteroidota bacterium]
MAKVKVTQIKSIIDRPKRQKDTMTALGLRRINQSVIKEVTPQIMGMIAKVSHLVVTETAID